jgi:hypothetical protein
MQAQFYLELYKSICEEKPEELDLNECLITSLPLQLENKITLECNHSFDYDALLKETYNRKYKIKNDSKLGKKQLQCPYCRNIQNGILPYRMNYPKYMDINYPIQHAMKTNKCNRIISRGHRKGEYCANKCTYELCTRCEKMKYQTLCNHIMLRGKRKGELCKRKCSNGSNKCKMHLK